LGQAVAFAGGGVSDGGSVTYAWSFGDGTGGATATPNHTYFLPGTYNWSLTVGDGKGASASASGTIVISAAPPTVAWRAPDQITDTSVVLHGAVNPMGGASSYRFDYGPSATYGAQTTQVAVGAGVAPIDASTTLTGLQAAHTYHARIVALQGQTAVYGPDQTFSTAAAPAGQSPNQPSATTKGPLHKTAAKIVCKVPRLTGKTLTQARKALTKAHCRLGTVRRRHTRTHHGRIVLQQRRAGKTYTRNTKVGVTVAK
jgi:PKD repeat protein